MTSKEKLITARSGISLDQAKEIMHKNRIEKLPIVNKDFELKGLITIKDIEKMRKFPFSCKDALGRLRVGAAVGVSKDRDARVEALLKAGCDVIAIDTAHGHSQNVIESVREIKKNFKNVQLIAGNIATKEGCEALIKAGCDGVKIGVGPGSICTTRIIAGIGVPQITAIMEVSKSAKKHGIPIIADGGIKFYESWHWNYMKSAKTSQKSK